MMGSGAKTQVQQGLPSTTDETYSKERPEHAGGSIDGDFIRTAASKGVSPVLRYLRKRPALQRRYVRLENLHGLQTYRTGQKPEPNLT
jgi:hypothetical protein